MSDDERLRELVLQELTFEPMLRERAVTAEVEAGTVTLAGTVESYAEKLAAEAAAHRVRGVGRLVVLVQVEPVAAHRVADADLARRVADVLAWSVTVPDGSVRADVEQGWVTLRGEVAEAHHRTAATAAIRQLAGVRGITDAITVRPYGIVADVRAQIESAFERYARLEAQHLQVEARDGKVLLSGRVRSWYERELALGAAWAAPGVREVEDRIVVAP